MLGDDVRRRLLTVDPSSEEQTVFFQKAALTLVGLLGGLAVGQALGADEIVPADFDKLRAMIKPRPGAALHEQLPWQASLWEARKKAAAEGKPLFVWGMAGEPLGCA